MSIRPRMRAVLLAGLALWLIPVAGRAQDQQGGSDYQSPSPYAGDSQNWQPPEPASPVPPPTPYGAPYGAPTASYNAPPAGGNITTQLLERVQTLEDQVRTLRGQVDELQNQSQRQQADLSKQLSDLSFQMQQGGGHAGVAPSGPQPMSPPPGNLALSGSGAEAPAPAAPRTSETILQEGNAALARRDYKAAEAAAREVMSQGRGPRSYDAQFLLAQSMAGQRNYQQAAIAYDDSYNRNKGGSHAQDSLLGLANSLLSLGDKSAACGALAKFRSAFPTVRSDLRDNVAALRGRAGCG
jgi:TolA-binding protein